MIEIICANCGKKKFIYKSQLHPKNFCNKSCARSFKNKIDNPSKHRNLKKENNPMWGRHPVAWNKGLTGEKSHNWRGGVHKRGDGYFRINIMGKRELLHRHLLRDKLQQDNVVHHKDKNPSNNSPENLEILPNQAEHARLHGKKVLK